MSSIVLFAFVLAFAGGLIAYFGDRLGTHVGKKRLTFNFWHVRLRPRHTAMLYTICSGSLVALLTLGILIVCDNAFKKALLEGPQLVFQNEDYRHKIKLQEVQALAEQKKADLAEHNRLQVEQRYLEERAKLLPLQRQVKETQQQLNTTRQQLANTKTALAVTNQRLGRAQQDLRVAQGEVTGARHSLKHLGLLGLRVVAQTRDWEQVALQARGVAKQGNLIYHRGEEVGRAVILTNQSIGDIQRALTTFLHNLAEDVTERGGAKQQAVVLLLPPQANQAARPDYERRTLPVLSQAIAEKKDVASVVVIARAKYNAFQSEPVGVFLQPYRNVLIYPKGTLLASQNIDGTQPTAQTLAALQALFARVRQGALLRGLIPQTDPQTGAPFVGALDGAKAFDLVRQIQQAGANAEVTAYVTDNVYSSGPLPMPARFSVGIAGQPPRLGERPPTVPDAGSGHS